MTLLVITKRSLYHRERGEVNISKNICQRNMNNSGFYKGGATFCGRDGLWDPGQGVCSANGSGAGPGRDNLAEEGRGEALSSVGRKRLDRDRGLQTAHGLESALDLARRCPVLFYETVVKEEMGQERLLRLSCGMRKVRLPDRGQELTLIVVKGFNLLVRRSRKSVWHVIASYMTRWRIEDVIRFLKQSYRLEDMRCLTYRRLQALMVLVTAAAYFAAVYLGLRMKLRVLAGQVLRASKRLFGIPDFRLYALADGIRQFLYSQTQGLKRLLELHYLLSAQPMIFDL